MAQQQPICISHSTGAGGEAIGRAVAQRLGFRYVDDEVIAEAAEWAEVDPALVADVERRKSTVSRLLGNIAAQSSPTRLPTGDSTRQLPTDADLRTVIVDAVRSVAAEGAVVIVAHAASFALAGRSALRVFVTGSPETRARRVAAERGMEERDAVKVIKEEDTARADYLKRFYAIDHELPTHFDIVISTDVLTPEKATDVLAAASLDSPTGS
jgi:cytidylate kinase